MLRPVALALFVAVPLAAQAPVPEAPAAPPQAPAPRPEQPPLGPLGRQATAAPAHATPAPAGEDPKVLAARATERIGLLQKETQQLAARSATALGELKKLEIERALRVEELARANAELAAVTARLDQTSSRLQALEARRVAQTPAVEARLVGLYKRGELGYARLLAGGVREWARASRAVIGLARVDQVRIDEHRHALATETAARTELEQARAAAADLQGKAGLAQAAVDKAVADRTRLVADLGRRRAMANEYVQELEGARLQFQSTMAGLPAASPVVDLPLRPFRGALEWPATGRVISRFGRNTDRFGTAVIRNGIEIAAAPGTRVRAVHGGTVAYAAPFSGFGILVIVDHGGNNFSLYGALSATGLRPGAAVKRGDLIGTSGVTLTGETATYFELRIDGRPVNPLEWLRSS